MPSSYSTGTSAHSRPSVYVHHAVGPRRRSASSAMRDDGAADVEGPQRQLRARLADRLRGQNADRLAHVHHVHGGQVAAVAHPADAALAPRR